MLPRYFKYIAPGAKNVIFQVIQIKHSKGLIYGIAGL
jgi:hypothetical protein